jgi:hypothetical protein
MNTKLSGLRITEDGMKAAYPPMLPKGVSEMTMTNVPFRGKMYDISVKNGTTRMTQK